MERNFGNGLQRDRVRAVEQGCPDEAPCLGQMRQALILGAVAETLGHQVRELLTIVDGHLSLAADDLAPDHEAHDSLARARAAAGLLATIVSPIFNFLCVREPRPAPVNLRRHFDSWASLYQRLLPRGQRLALTLAPDLWTAQVDPVHFEQVFVSMVVGLSRELPDAGTILVSGRNIQLEGQGAQGAAPGEYIRLSVGGSRGAHACGADDHVLSLAACQSLMAQQGGALVRELTEDGAVRLHLLLPRSVAG